jgi:hypothetical protein
MVTVTYSFVIPALLPTSAAYVVSTVPPTAFQASQVSRIAAIVNFSADTDTTALVTHNYGLTTNQSNNIQPDVGMYIGTSGTANGLFSAQLTNSVALTISKGATVAGSGTASVVVQIHLPNSLVE